jgi:NAD(P)-dependent dehydrogenase (short-subunit alcohol dehydrogenase family)
VGRRAPRLLAVDAIRVVTRGSAHWKAGTAKPLQGKVAVVAGATRGAGRAIAVCLGAAGATVYLTGRSTRKRPAPSGRPETIEETAALVRKAGGKAIAMRVDHTQEREVRNLFDHVRRRENGRLDILVNDIWGGDELTEWGRPFWELSLEKGRTMLERAIYTHIVTSRLGVPLMLSRKEGWVFEITDGDHESYRGNFYYDLAKMGVIRLARDMAEDFRAAGMANLSAIAVTPGYLRSEFVLDQWGVTEANWREALHKPVPPLAGDHFYASETPFFVGRGIVALASDPKARRWSGRVLASWTLARRYGFTDIDGTQPNWGGVF